MQERRGSFLFGKASYEGANVSAFQTKTVAGDEMRRSNRCILILGLIVLAASVMPAAVAQEPGQQQPAPPPSQLPQTQPPQPAPASDQHYQTENPEQLQQLVAPIALYPDSLVASILAASSYPSEIAEANDFLAARQNFTPEQIASDADKQSWAAAVKSLLAFPPVVRNLASNLSWTSELGDAYYNQPSDVMNAIQEMRRDAKKHGALKSNDQIKVIDKKGYITIEPKEPDSRTVYLPAYDPWLVYGYPIAPWPGWVEVPGVWWGGPGVDFGIGFGLGPFWGFGWGWPYWGLDWWGRGIYWHGAPYWHGSPAFFDRDRFYHGSSGFGYHPGLDERGGRGFDGRAPGMRSGPFSGVNHGGATRGFSARGQSSFGGGFQGGGFRGGGFSGGGGGFHGGGGRR
jgi:uncharacterized membrane protein YgcG